MDKRSRIVIWTTVVLFLTVVMSSRVCNGAPDITADAAVVLDARTGSILYGRCLYQERPPASTTKILTAIIALEKAVSVILLL